MLITKLLVTLNQSLRLTGYITTIRLSLFYKRFFFFLSAKHHNVLTSIPENVFKDNKHTLPSDKPRLGILTDFNTNSNYS